MNKKGFAISVVLYTMVILIVGIFYLLLGIVRHRYTVGNDFREVIIDDISNEDGCTDWIQTDTIYTDECTSYGNPNTGTSYSTCSSSPMWKFTKYSSQCSANVIEYSTGYSYTSFSAAETACYNYVFTDCPQESANDCAWDSAYIKRTYSRTCRYSNNEKPVCKFVSGPSSSSINANATATYFLECTDNNVLFSDSVISSSDLVLTSSGVVTIQTPVAVSISNGFRYIITVTGKAAGTTALRLVEGAVSDNDGNGNASITSDPITIKANTGGGSNTDSCSFYSGFNSGTYNAPFEIHVSCPGNANFELYKDGVLFSSKGGKSYLITLTASGTYEFYLNDYDSEGNANYYQTRTYIIN